MTIGKGVATVGACTFGGGAVGGILGYAIGALAPDAYVAMFRLPPDGQINPVEVGVGLGIGQGMVLGAVIGVSLGLKYARESTTVDSQLPMNTHPNR